MTNINERAEVITVGGEEYELLLTTAATKEIGKEYGGLQELGDELLKPEKFEQGFDTITKIICLLANQSIRRHNMKNDSKKSELTPEYLELMSEPWELKNFTAAITAAMQKGTARNVRSAEDGDSKNDSGE